MHRVDAVAGLAGVHTRASAARALHVRPEMEPILTGRVPPASALAALKHRLKTQLLKPSPMYALERFPASGACVHELALL